MTRRFPGGRRATVLLICWIGLLLVGIGWGAVIFELDDSYCTHPQLDSNYGNLSWSVAPPGPVCTFTAEANGFAEVQGPTPVMSIWIIVLVGLGLAVLWAIRKDPRRESFANAPAISYAELPVCSDSGVLIGHSGRVRRR